MNFSQKEKTPIMELRFKSKRQRNAFKKIAIKNGRSMNAELNTIIDMHIVGQHSFIEKKTQPTQ